ncbi:MAG: hypothetical protein O2799_10145, partial [Planctomycetota bacterium]|nr:hypothetical protein [Planctomycetota bacterium]
PAALAMAAAAVRRPGPRWLARRGTAEHLVLEAEGAPIEWQADGDPQAPAPRLELQVEPGALQVVAP